MEPRFEIPEGVLQKVTAALNQAIMLADMFEPTLKQGILDAALALDDAINESPGGA